MKACFYRDLGYIGLPTAIIAADNGMDVTGVDINPEVVNSVNSGKIHFSEPGLEEICKRVVSGGTLKLLPNPGRVMFMLLWSPLPSREIMNRISHSWNRPFLPSFPT